MTEIALIDIHSFENAVDKVERAAISVLLKFSHQINEAMTFAHWLAGNPTLAASTETPPVPPNLQQTWEIGYELRAWVIQQHHKRSLQEDCHEADPSA